MNVLFIVTSFWAYGELSIACEFAKRVKEYGYNPYFIIPPSHKKIIQSYEFSFTTLIPQNGKINKIILQDIENTIKPEIVILADFLNYNFCERHYGLIYDDLKAFSGKIGTFDNFNWEITGKDMDTYGFKAKKFAEIDIRKYGFSLCPCPIAYPVSSADNNTYYYNLISDVLPYEIDNTIKWKKELKIPSDKKVILFTHATWQETYKQYPDVKPFVEANNLVFERIIQELAETHYVIGVGAKGRYSDIDNDNIRFVEQLSPQEFEKYLLATDLFISRNITSTSLAKAVLSGIPTVNFSNSLFFSSKKPFNIDDIHFTPTKEITEMLKSLKRCYPYRMFPVGWYKLLNPLLRKNPYYKIVVNLEQFDINGSLEKINRELTSSDKENIRMKDREIYIKTIKNLPKIGDILNSILKR